MDQARANELAGIFLRDDNPDGAAYNGVELQELIFLIHYAKGLAASQPARNEQLNNRIWAFTGAVLDKVKKATALYIAYDKQTRYPYVDAESRVWLFSKEQYAAEAADYFLQQFVILEMKKLSGEEIMRTIGLLHILGLPTILLDNGQYHMELQRDELMPPMDWSGTPDIQIPVTNPGLQQAMLQFFQTMSARQHTAEQQQRLQSMEARMLDELTGARYLVPIQLVLQDTSAGDGQGRMTLNQGDRILIGALDGEQETKWLPAFTDCYEFEKAYDKGLWSSNVATYEDLWALSGGMTGIVINARGHGLTLDSRNRAKIEAYVNTKPPAPPASPSQGQ